MKAAARRALNSPASYAARGLEGDNILNGIAYPEVNQARLLDDHSCQTDWHPGDDFALR